MQSSLSWVAFKVSYWNQMFKNCTTVFVYSNLWFLFSPEIRWCYFLFLSEWRTKYNSCASVDFFLGSLSDFLLNEWISLNFLSRRDIQNRLQAILFDIGRVDGRQCQNNVFSSRSQLNERIHYPSRGSDNHFLQDTFIATN